MHTPSTYSRTGSSSLPLAVAPATVLLVDDHEFIRHGVRMLFAEIGGVPVDWVEATSLSDAIERYGQLDHVSAVLLDLNLADCKGLQGLRQFLKVYPDARVAVFSATQDEFVIGQARALGAIGYVPKSAARKEMEQMLASLVWGRDRDGLRGGAGSVFPKASGSSVFNRVSELGPRHIEILELVLSGCTNQEISNSLDLSLGTVKNYVSALLLALDVRSRSHLVSLFC